jgi:predicted nucleic acid-binding protein
MESLVFDTSAILNFGHRGELAALLKKLVGEYRILTTPEARNELTDPKRKEFYAALLKDHFVIQSTTTSFDIVTLARLARTIDPAEITVMTLASELKGISVLDERAARREAKDLGLKITGTLGLMNEGLKKSWLTEADCLNTITKLCASGFAIPRLKPGQSFADYFSSFAET